MEDLTAFQRDMLYIIANQGDPNGVAIRDELDEHYEEKITAGRLYPNLDTLVEKRLIEKGKHSRRANYYALTSRGRRELETRRGWENQYLDV